jgi:putative tryptophan/tyrosine transport system substrate-binding protein
MHRRDTLAFILAFCATPLAGHAQQTRVYRIAWLSGTAIAPGGVWSEFIAGMRELGWSEGQNFTVENLRYEGRSERLPALAAEAVERKFDLIICAGTPPAVAARNATTAIPIVFYFVGDPLGTGLVASLARPGGNITGLGGLGAGVYGKMLEVLVEAAPNATRIAMLTNPTFPLHAGFAADAEAAARKLKLTLKSVELRSPEDLDSAFAEIAREKADALLILGQPFLFGQGPRVAGMAIAQRLPAMIPFEQVVHDGILMSFGSKIVDDARRLPYFVDRILKGASPGSLPVEQPSRFYLTINLKTANAIGVSVPRSLLQRADLVIE